MAFGNTIHNLKTKWTWFLLRAKDRDFLPSLQNYFEEAIEQLDPANGIEDEYKKVNNGEWGWRALRLMSR